MQAFISTLRGLAETCEFGAFLDEALRDRIVCGMRSTTIRNKLLTEENLNLGENAHNFHGDGSCGKTSNSHGKDLQLLIKS